MNEQTSVCVCMYVCIYVCMCVCKDGSGKQAVHSEFLKGNLKNGHLTHDKQNVT
jgi:hypothetical protein